MEPGCIGKSNTNNLPAPTDLTENPYGKKKHFFNDAIQKSVTLVPAVKYYNRSPVGTVRNCNRIRAMRADF